MIDDVVKQKFTQLAKERWKYDVVTKVGKNFSVEYHAQPFGYMKEILKQEGMVIWDREFKIGENVAKTWVQQIKNG